MFLGLEALISRINGKGNVSSDLDLLAVVLSQNDGPVVLNGGHGSLQRGVALAADPSSHILKGRDREGEGAEAVAVAKVRTPFPFAAAL